MEWGKNLPYVVTIWRTWKMEDATLNLTVTDATEKVIYENTNGTLVLPAQSGRRLAMLASSSGRLDKSGVPHGGICDGASGVDSSCGAGGLNRTSRRPNGRPRVPPRRGKSGSSGGGGGLNFGGKSGPKGHTTSSGATPVGNYNNNGMNYGASSGYLSSNYYKKGFTKTALGFAGVGLIAGTVFLVPAYYMSSATYANTYNQQGPDEGMNRPISYGQDMFRDDVMATGFSPQSVSPPLTFTLKIESAIPGVQYNPAMCEDGYSWDGKHIFVSLTKFEEVKEVEGDWAEENSGFIFLITAGIVIIGGCFFFIVLKKIRNR
jgi:hypothetical protein